MTLPLSRDITDDEAFVDQLRVTLRFFAAVLVRRTQKVLITETTTSNTNIRQVRPNMTSGCFCLRWTWLP
jgi:hypothetical protein